ncbi:MAG: hypothetical protein SGARI_003723 [Bacillariaceae sp.]
MMEESSQQQQQPPVVVETVHENEIDLVVAAEAVPASSTTASAISQSQVNVAALPTNTSQIQPGSDQEAVSADDAPTDAQEGAVAPHGRPQPQRRTVRIRQRVRNSNGESSTRTTTRTIPLRFNDQVRLNLGGGNVVTVPLQPPQPGRRGVDGVSTSTGNANVRAVQIPPLTPQPLSETEMANRVGEGEATTSQEAEDPSLQKFKCDICYDFFRSPTPVGT